MSNKVFDFWGDRYKFAQQIDDHLSSTLIDLSTERLWWGLYRPLNREQIHECFYWIEPQWKKKEEKKC